MSEKFQEGTKVLIKQEYVEGSVGKDGVRVYLSIAKLAENYNVKRSTVYKVSLKDNWQSQRKQFQDTLEEEIRQNRVAVFTRASKELDDHAIDIGTKLLSFVANKLVIAGTLKAYEIKELSLAAATAQKIGKLALGEPQEINKVSSDATTPESFIRIMEELDEVRVERSRKSNHKYN
jgi:hypothetical protein